nr:transposase [Porphyromonas gulae]
MATKPTEPAPSFLQVYTQVRRDRMKHSFLRQINACVDWRGIRTLLNKKYTKTQNAVGNPAYDALLMFKILLLETWYGLSDYEVEERINDSLLFSEFLGLDLGFPSPDHSTISRFRSELTRLGIMDKLFRELNKQFKKHGISRIDQGAIVDASIVVGYAKASIIDMGIRNTCLPMSKV